MCGHKFYVNSVHRKSNRILGAKNGSSIWARKFGLEIMARDQHGVKGLLQSGPVSVSIQTQFGGVWKRHKDQIKCPQGNSEDTSKEHNLCNLQ